MTRSTRPSRAHLIKLIHVAKRALNLDDDTYRMALMASGSAASCADMSDAALQRALKHFRAIGFVSTSTRPKPQRRPADDPQSRKIRSLWLQLKAVGAVRNASETALAAFVKRMTGVDALDWLNTREASRVIEELKAWLRRVDGAPNG